MARTKDVVLTPEQKEQMVREFFDSLKPMESQGNARNRNSLYDYDDVENPELRAIVEDVAAQQPPTQRTSQRTRLNRHRIRRNASVASSARQPWRKAHDRVGHHREHRAPPCQSLRGGFRGLAQIVRIKVCDLGHGEQKGGSTN